MFFDKKTQARNFKDLTQRINLDILQEDAKKQKQRQMDFATSFSSISESINTEASDGKTGR